MPDESLKNYPSFFEILSDIDKEKYMKLHEKVGSPVNRYNRNKRLQTFNEILDDIKRFCIQEDGEDWRRYLVCGICWINDDIVINTRQLRILIEKSKSTINGSFAKMGYCTVPMKEHDTKYIIQFIPYLKSHPQELRQWTTRKNCISTKSHSDDDSFADSKLKPQITKEKKSLKNSKAVANSFQKFIYESEMQFEEKKIDEIENCHFTDLMISDFPCFSTDSVGNFKHIKMFNFDDYENNYLNLDDTDKDNSFLKSYKCF